jgi:hypothetical protein
MAKFRDIKTLQKFASVHASVHNHFNLDRLLNRRDVFKQIRSRCSGRVASTRGVKMAFAGVLETGSHLA